MYSILSSIYDDSQAKIDAAIETIEPNIGKSPSPTRRPYETTFTRLRNELAHYREGASIFETHREIRLHLPRFEWIVGELVRPKIESP